ncbi:RDD family protein [Brevibacillus gelatini]|uniref:RDD family protein n=1 Tax=Brevibacillus gelatini TaxID=1655277 RepID=UPI003D815995
MENHPLPQTDSSLAPPLPQADSPLPAEPKRMGDITQTYGASIFFQRWAAHVIDYILLFSFLFGMFAFIGRADKASSTLFFLLALTFGILGYYILLEGLTGYTIGKFALRIKAVNEHGRPPGIGKSILRSLLRIVETNPLLLGGLPAGISVLATKKKQRLGDLAANTFVVKVKDLEGESKKSVTLYAVIFAALALFSILIGIFGISYFAKTPPKKETFYSADQTLQIYAYSDWKASSLPPDASLAISNPIADKHLFVFPDAKNELESPFTLQQYTDAVMTNLYDKLSEPSAGSLVRLTVDGHLSAQFTMQGTVEGENVAYLVTVVETPTHFYQIMCVTQARKFDDLEAELKEISSSFHVVGEDGL